MKVLMFGWEFPPHITGGLGTACFGLTKGLATLKKVKVTFVVPRILGDENHSIVTLIGANKVPVCKKDFEFQRGEKMEYIEIDSPIVPYVSEEEFWTLKSGRYTRETRFVKTGDGHTIDFKGGYGVSLINEIKNYALIAEIIATNGKYDIIHAHDWLTFPAGMAAKRATGKPLVVHVHATDFDRSGGNVNPRVYAIEREGMETADHIIAVSALTKNTLVEKYGISPKKITVVYNAVEHVKIKERNGFNKGIDEKIVTFLGRITHQKGPEYFIEAAALVLKKMKNVRFVMAGSGDLMHTMITYVAALGIADRFHFTGFLKGDDVNYMLRMTDVFVMPSVSEPFGIVPLEAMQFNVPVIISHQSGVSEIIEHALKIDFWDTHAMADAIYGLLNYKALSTHFKNEGKQEVEHIEWKDSAKNVSKVYETVLVNAVIN